MAVQLPEVRFPLTKIQSTISVNVSHMHPFTGIHFSCDAGKEHAANCPSPEHESVKKANQSHRPLGSRTSCKYELCTVLASISLEFIAPCKNSFGYPRSFKRREEFSYLTSVGTGLHVIVETEAQFRSCRLSSTMLLSLECCTKRSYFDFRTHISSFTSLCNLVQQGKDTDRASPPLIW